MKLDIPTLVELVANRAAVDKTAPDPTNLRNGWRTDGLLGDIDALIVIKYNNPAVYADFGRQLFDKIKDLPEMAALAQLAVFRGERLLPIDSHREQMLVQLAKDLEQAVSVLPEGTRKMRCASLLQYHEGVFYNDCGRFDLAAELQGQSGQEAERFGDKPGEAIAYFLKALYLLKDSLRKGEPDARLQELFSGLEQAFSQLSQGLVGSTLQVQWAQGNGPTHMLEACVWLDQSHDSWENWLQTMLAASEKLGDAFRPFAEFVKALDMARHNDPKTDEALNVVANSDSTNEVKATALLIMARRAHKAGNAEAAQDLVAKMPDTGAQHVLAIAKRLVS